MEASEAEVAEEIQIAEATAVMEARMVAVEVAEVPIIYVTVQGALVVHMAAAAEEGLHVVILPQMGVMEQILRGWASHSQGLELEAPQAGLKWDKQEAVEAAATAAMAGTGPLLAEAVEAAASEPMADKDTWLVAEAVATAVQVETEVGMEAAVEADTEKPLHLPEMIAIVVIRVRGMEAEQEVQDLVPVYL